MCTSLLHTFTKFEQYNKKICPSVYCVCNIDVYKSFLIKKIINSLSHPFLLILLLLPLSRSLLFLCFSHFLFLFFCPTLSLLFLCLFCFIVSSRSTSFFIGFFLVILREKINPLLLDLLIVVCVFFFLGGVGVQVKPKVFTIRRAQKPKPSFFIFMNLSFYFRTLK